MSARTSDGRLTSASSRAFQERGAKFDILGGASVGAAVLAGFALLLTPAELDLALKDIFVSSRGFKRRTFPRYALLDHVEFDKALQRQCRGAQIEDVWLPYFAVATDVDRAGQSLYVMRRGELWKAVRASGSIPAVLPPMFTDDGRMLVDGGVVDNIPLAPMKAIKSGPNLVVHFGVNPVEPYNVKYESIPGRRQLMIRMLNPFARGTLPRVPGPISVLRRCFGNTTRIRTCFRSRLWISCLRRRHSRARASSTSIATPRSTRRPIDGATFSSTSLPRRGTRRWRRSLRTSRDGLLRWNVFDAPWQLASGADANLAVEVSSMILCGTVETNVQF